MFRNRLLSICAVLLCVLAISVLPAWGQATNTGTIIGSVFDNTGAFVPGAKVTITEMTTSATRSTVTDKTGRFVFADVDPGNYNITVTKQGFATTTVTDQAVAIGTQLTENVKLQLGSVSTTVTVTETPGAELQTLNPTVGTTLSGQIILNLPNTSRDASSLAVLQPGQNINGNVGGVATDQNSFELDGGDATDDMSGDNNTYITSFAADTAGGIGAYHSSGYAQVPSAVVPVPVASIEEFKISTANQTADFNGGAGSQMQLVTKRGTNTFHGGVYEYYLDNDFAGANTWDNKYIHSIDPSISAANPSAHFSRFGADAGGKIPGLNVLGGGWYVFGLYEGYRYPQNESFEQDFPLPSLRAGIIHEGTATYNINPFPVVDPGCGAATADCGVTTTGQTIAPTVCPGGPCDPRGLGTTTNGVAGGPPNPVIALWNQYLPLPNDCSSGDGLNYCGYKGSISIPQSSNFGVIRIDHDFASKWHFNATYHYYNLKKTVADQWDVGGFFPGDTMGQYAAIRHKPQVPWLYTAGLTTEISPNVTNNVRFSFTRNYWAYQDPSGVPNVAGYPAALEVGGEQSDVFGPYDTYNQGTRFRFWDGKDTMIGDDISWLKGNHLVQFGGSLLHNSDTHNRNDNGETINTFEQYIIGSGGNYAANLGSYNMDFSAYTPAAIAGTSNGLQYENLYSMALGIVDETQSLYTRGLGTLATGLPLNPRTSCAIAAIPATSGCISSPPLTDTSVIPTYNLYLTDSWHMKPTFSLNYGLGYTVEMPPYSTNGGYQTVMVDQNNQIISSAQYLQSEEQAALLGQAYAPLLGFDTIRNVPGHSHYPYDPFLLGLSPRIGMAWNIRPNTVIRGGYARIFGRINGVNPILVPMLTPGLMQPATCGGPTNTGTCGTATTPTTPLNAFRVGVDGVNAPLPAPSANLPQPWYPGVNDVATGAGETFDPDFKPNRNDEFTLSIQHQFSPKVMIEVGYIGRKLSNEIQYYSLTNVPYMMTLGGQSFANAWKNVMVATNYGTSNLPNVAANTSPVAAQPFFETAIGGKAGAFSATGGAGGTPGYCYNTTAGAPYPNCTAAFIANNDASGSGLMTVSDAFDSWGSVSNAGDFNFGRSFTSDPIPASCTTTITLGCSGQSPSIVTTASNGYGNYNAAYFQFTFQNWHGLTMKSNFTYGKALGTGDVVQASSSYATVDPFNLSNNYGPQYYNEKFAFNLFLNYAVPIYSSQQGFVGRVLGGWSFSPLFTAGSGFPVQMTTSNGDCGSFGECNTAYIFAYENMVPTENLHYSSSAHHVTGTVCGTVGRGYNVFSDPDATCPQMGGIFGDPVRNPILGLDMRDGSGGPVVGLPFFNLDLGVTKKININERFNSSLYFDWTNVLNHMQPADPCFLGYAPAYWGVLGCGGNLQANNPRQLQLGLDFNF
jgi:Carboxypeptidase regulatory-like domain